MYKFNGDDRITLGGIPGTVVKRFAGTIFREGIYEVAFDDHALLGVEDAPRVNRFNMDWFDERAELIPAPPKPTAKDFFDSLVPGDRFTSANKDGNSIWRRADYTTYIGIGGETSGGNGHIIQGIRHNIDQKPLDLYFLDTDILTKID